VENIIKKNKNRTISSLKSSLSIDDILINLFFPLEKEFKENSSRITRMYFEMISFNDMKSEFFFT
jgi:hypothetical protein